MLVGKCWDGVGDGWGAVNGLTPQCERLGKGGGERKHTCVEGYAALSPSQPDVQLPRDPQVGDVSPLNW